MHNFDPDYIVPLSKDINIDFSRYHAKTLKYEEIFSKDAINYGTSLFEVLSNFYEREVKFVRKNPIEVISPQLSRKYNLFLKSIFGQLPHMYIDSYKEWEKITDAQSLAISLDNYPEIIKTSRRNTKLFPRRLTGLYIRSLMKDSFERTNVFYMDAENCLDIIDYWNLRASGRNVLPIPKQANLQSETFKENINNQIKIGLGTHKHNPDLEYHTYIVKGRSIKKPDFESFIQNVTTIKTDNTQLTVMSSYPDLWHILRRHGQDYGLPTLEVAQKSVTISGDDPHIRVQGLKPEFSDLMEYNGNPKYVNEIEINLFGNDGTKPEMLPHTNYAREPLHTLGALGFDKSRISSEGLVVLEENLSDDIHITLPQSEDLFFSYLKVFGINAQKAKPGRITYKMLDNIGGIRRLDTLAEKELLLLINEISKGSGYVRTSIIRDKLREIKGRNKHVLAISAEGTIHNLLESKALELGLEIECPICTRNSWYSTYSLKKNLECPNCLAEFEFPTFEPEKDTKWAYRFIGPFSLPNYANGSYSVLLTLHFFVETLNLKVTSAFNFVIMKGNQQDYEIDLGFITKDRLTRAKEVLPVFCECKSFGTKPELGLTKKSINNTLRMCNEFPYSVAVFSILRESLTPREKRMLKEKVIANYKLRAKRKPYTDIIILTGRELLTTERLSETWSKGTQQQQNLSKRADWLSLEELAEATCFIHLDTPYFHQWYEQNIKPKIKK